MAECIHKTFAGSAYITHAHPFHFCQREFFGDKGSDKGKKFGKKLRPVLSTALQKQSDPKPTIIYGVPLGPPALSLLGQRCQIERWEDEEAKVRRCNSEV